MSSHKQSAQQVETDLQEAAKLAGRKTLGKLQTPQAVKCAAMCGKVKQTTKAAKLACSEMHRQKDAWQVADSAGSKVRGNVRQDEADSEGSEACRQGKSHGKIKCPVSRNEQ